MVENAVANPVNSAGEPLETARGRLTGSVQPKATGKKADVRAAPAEPATTEHVLIYVLYGGGGRWSQPAHWSAGKLPGDRHSVSGWSNRRCALQPIGPARVCV